jgi:4'-phosphopantetheinyl transferase
MTCISDALWAVGPRLPNIAANEIHVWRVDLMRIAEPLDVLAEALSEAEKNRAARFYSEADRRNFQVRRAVLRKILASYLRILPHEVAFTYTTCGQPGLDGEPFSDLKFSLAHSGDLVLVAVAQDWHIGVDVEWEREFADMTDIVCRYFSDEERLEFFALPAADQERAFYCGWTRKEAILKAIGQGIAFGVNHLTVTLDPNKPARLVSVHGRSMPVSPWSLYSLIPLPGYVAALAVSGAGHRVTCWQFDSA